MGAVAQLVERTKERLDGWVNALMGSGFGAYDARVASIVTWTPISEDDIANLYAGDSMARKVNDKVVDEAMKRGYKWTGITDEDAKKLKAALDLLNFDEHMVNAWKKARLFGGAGILKLYDDALDLAQPAGNTRVIRALHTFNRFELGCSQEDRNKDILSRDFGMPVLYTFQGRSATLANRTLLKIHASRVVRFMGAPLPDVLSANTDTWGDSVLNRPKDAIRNYSHAHDALNLAVKDLSVGVFKVSGLANMLEANDDDAIQRRLQAVNLSKSIARAVILDANGEDFDYKTRSLAGAADCVEKATDRVVAETDIPKTVLMGGSPQGGLGQSGNHESENWYSYIDAERNNYLAPRMLEVAREKAAELNIKADELSIEFAALWQMSDKEMADVRLVMAQVDEKYNDMGVLDVHEITASRFGGPKYSIDTHVDMDERERQREPVQDPGAPSAPDASKVPPEMLAEATNIQGTALNGAQVASLVQVATMVQSNQLDTDAARGILKMAFPTITDDQLTAILTKSNTVTPPPAQGAF